MSDFEVGVKLRSRVGACPDVEGGSFFDPGFCCGAPVSQFVISQRKVYGLFFVRGQRETLEAF